MDSTALLDSKRGGARISSSMVKHHLTYQHLRKVRVVLISSYVQLRTALLSTDHFAVTGIFNKYIVVLKNWIYASVYSSCVSFRHFKHSACYSIAALFSVVLFTVAGLFSCCFERGYVYIMFIMSCTWSIIFIVYSVCPVSDM